jgi:subtilase family serine protease
VEKIYEELNLLWRQSNVQQQALKYLIVQRKSQFLLNCLFLSAIFGLIVFAIMIFDLVSY